MAYAARRQQSAPVTIEAQRTPSAVCRVHSCLRCRSAIASSEPCSFSAAVRGICSVCRGQEQVLHHLPPSRTWGAALARTRR